MTEDDVDFIKSMCFQGPDMTKRQEHRVRRIIDDMRMLRVELRVERAEKDAEIATLKARTDSTDKDAQISEQIRVNRRLREHLSEKDADLVAITEAKRQMCEEFQQSARKREAQLAEALYVLEVIARRYKYRLDEETHDHIRKTLDPSHYL